MTFQRLEHETDEEFQRFVGWVLSDPRPAIQSDVLGLSVRNDWAARAGRYDTLQRKGELQAIQPYVKKTIAQKVADLVDMELDKYLREAEERPNSPILSPAELIRFAQLLKPASPLPREENETTDGDSTLRLEENRARFEELSDEDLEALRDLRKELQG